MSAVRERSPSPGVRRALVLGALALASLSACGGSPPPPEKTAAPVKAAPAKAAAAEAPPPEVKDEPMPTECSKEGGSDICVPPASFAKRVCQAGSPEMALVLFAKGTPWVRGYLRRDTEAWDASGGPSSAGKLKYTEEVLILVKRTPNTGGMVVSGAGGSYDVLRWDGTCASLQAEEVTTRPIDNPLWADIPWRKLDDNFQEALRKDDKLSNLVVEQKKECKGVSAGQVSDKCEKATKALSKAIVRFVRGGGALPPPPKLP
jgi:hypothetical protein